MVERTRIACPETGELEDVEWDRTPVGIVVTGCSRARDGALACPRACARRMDLRDRDTLDDRERVLVVVTRLRDDAARVGSILAQTLADDGLDVELCEIGARSAPPLEDYDAVLLSAQVRFGRHGRAMIDYIREQLPALAAIPAFFCSVGGHGVFHRADHVERMTLRTGWHPALAASFADASSAYLSSIRAFAQQVSDAIPPAVRAALR